MKELRCLNCDESFEREQGHRCLKSRWMLEPGDANTILQDIDDELGLDENEFISLDTEQLPELLSVCAEIFNRNQEPYTDSSLYQQVTLGADQHSLSSTVSFSEKSEASEKSFRSDDNAVPGPSRLPFNDSNGSVCQEEFQPKLLKAEPAREKVFTCNDCKKVFKRKDRLRKHLLIHSGEKKHRCNVCGESFLRQPDLKKHTRIHTGEKPFSCLDCGKRFKRRHHLMRHSLVHTGKKPFTCDVCDKSFTQKSNLKNHMNIHRERIISDDNAVPGPSRLPFNDSNLSVCQEDVQPKLLKSEPAHEKVFTCNDCKKVFKRKDSLRKHLLIHSGEKKHRCNVCEKTFLRQAHLKMHTRIHTGERPFSCLDCGKRFKGNHHLQRHSLVHTGEKPFKCDVCDKSYRRKSKLKIHMNIHRELTISDVHAVPGPSRLPFNDSNGSVCQEEFQPTLLKAEPAHEKVFICNDCQKVYKDEYDLKSHMLIHGGEKKHKCDVCEKSFLRQLDLKKHTRICGK
ncbi:zinc finger protein 271-like [Argiope bruennichi]|uniref:zinc finger protein 271-like n=1 Tax=Argiope bruennichi TaxID=94029 RepID=UPI0024943E07|nr:zinc finger protein 271-like [Argiope bruennichi]